MFDSDNDPFDSDNDVEVDVISREHDDAFIDSSDNELDNDDDSDDASDAEMDTFFSAPFFSPMCPSHYDKNLFLDSIDWDVIDDQNLNDSDHKVNHDTFISDSIPAGGFDCDSDRTQMDTLVSTPANGHIVPYDDKGAFLDNIIWDEKKPQDDVLQTGANWKGFKLVGDNVDKNVKPSLQRFDNKTNSLHYFHYYTILDRLDLSKCSENDKMIMITKLTTSKTALKRALVVCTGILLPGMCHLPIFRMTSFSPLQPKLTL